jgi:excisionase family DNA binding protein
MTKQGRLAQRKAAYHAELAKENEHRPIPKLAFKNETEAADAVGMSRSTFRKHVLPTLRVVRVGRRIIIPVAEVERWLETNAEAI